MHRGGLLLAALALLVAGCGDDPVEGFATSSVVGGESISREAVAELTLSHGQLVYVPVYSHLSFRQGGQAFAYAANVSIHNTDREHPILLASAKYYDTNGKLLREYLEEPRVLEPLATTTLFVKETDLEGGIGANFLVEWRAQDVVTEPLIEAIMIGTREVRTSTFRSPGRVIEELGEE